MKASELRMGNTLQWYEPNIEFTTCSVVELLKDDRIRVKLDCNGWISTDYHINYQSLKPIRINVDMLIKAGFKRVGDNIFRLGDLKYVLKEKNTEICHMGSYFQYGVSPIYNIIYFHQLQNLVSLLTGQELILTTK